MHTVQFVLILLLGSLAGSLVVRFAAEIDANEYREIAQWVELHPQKAPLVSSLMEDGKITGWEKWSSLSLQTDNIKPNLATTESRGRLDSTLDRIRVTN